MIGDPAIDESITAAQSSVDHDLVWVGDHWFSSWIVSGDSQNGMYTIRLAPDGTALGPRTDHPSENGSVAVSVAADAGAELAVWSDGGAVRATLQRN